MGFDNQDQINVDYDAEFELIAYINQGGMVPPPSKRKAQEFDIVGVYRFAPDNARYAVLRYIHRVILVMDIFASPITGRHVNPRFVNKMFVSIDHAIATMTVVYGNDGLMLSVRQSHNRTWRQFTGTTIANPAFMTRVHSAKPRNRR